MPAPNYKPNEKLPKEINLETSMPKRQEAPPTIAPELPPMIELPETKPKEKEGFLDETIESLKNTLRRTKKKPTAIPQVRDAVALQVEKIMEEGLADAYREMTPLQQQEFKIEGEKTALKIRNLITAGRAKVKKIFQLIIKWLKLLPGVNKFFLEQEAKIKTDKIVAFNKTRNNRDI